MKKVAAYCRVSTDKDDQANSLENQKNYFEEYIKRNEQWEFVGLYVDEGISGTNISKRVGFKNMISDAENKKFDLIITKEISRFARNTLDSIFYTRKLKSYGIGVIFANDNINTLDPDSELRLTIMASIAQEESRKTSDRVKWGQKRCMEKGTVFGTKLFGFNLKNGELTVNEEEAKIVRLIFKMYLEDGMGTMLLARKLEDMGILTPNKCKRWSDASIFKMLRNEKYVGDLKQKKTITKDYLSHKKTRNKGEEEYVFIKDHHEPIVSREVFDAVQREIERRRTYTFDESKYSNRYVWSGKIICGNCASRFVRRVSHKGMNCEAVLWQCYTNSRYGIEKINAVGDKVGCNIKALHETALEKLFMLVLKDLIKNREQIIQNLEKVVLKALENSNVDEQIKDIESQINKIKRNKDKLIDLYSDEIISKAEFKERNDEYNAQVVKWSANLNELKELEERHKKNTDIIDKIKATISNLANLKQFSESICKELLEKVVVHGKNDIKFYIYGNIEKKVYFEEEVVQHLSMQQYLHRLVSRVLPG